MGANISRMSTCDKYVSMQDTWSTCNIIHVCWHARKLRLGQNDLKSEKTSQISPTCDFQHAECYLFKLTCEKNMLTCEINKLTCYFFMSTYQINMLSCNLSIFVHAPYLVACWNKKKLHVNIFFSHVNMTNLHVNMNKLHVNINKWHFHINKQHLAFWKWQYLIFFQNSYLIAIFLHVNMLHVDITILHNCKHIYFACWHISV